MSVGGRFQMDMLHQKTLDYFGSQRKMRALLYLAVVLAVRICSSGCDMASVKCLASI